jgi:16S rRNA (adenine1518-N6/adenine1519-N6)-dimethyltransferase
MAEYLEDTLADLNGEVLHFDFLRFNPRKYFEAEPFGLIGNFPYNISSQILIRMIKFRDLIPEMVGMFQKEVADRIVATKGDKSYGVISLLVQAFYEGKILFKVDAGSFFPPPKVKSAVVRLVRKPEGSLGCDYQMFRRVVKAAFGQRRKMLRNSMKTFLKGDPVLQDSFFTRRPESLSLEEFVVLTNIVAKAIRKYEFEGKDQ